MNEEQTKEAIAKDITKLAVKTFIKKHPWVLLVIAGIFLIIFCGIFVVAYVTGVFAADSKTPISGGSTGGYAYVIDGKNISNIKVRLLKCEGNDPVPGEELIDFETYIIGVVYAENSNGPYEALKAQAVAARSYALTRPKAMNNAFGISLEQEDNQWVLSIRSCTNDQVFCNPDEGCWSKVTGGQTSTSNPAGYADCTVYSGTSETYWSRPALSEDNEIRRAVKETKGQVLVDSNGNIVYTPFVSSTQKRWNSLANNGYDYFEILADTYGAGVSLESPDYISGYVEGNGKATGNYAHPCPDLVRVSSRFGPRYLESGYDYHEGIDLAAPTGTNTYAFDGGTVTIAKGGCIEGDFYCNGQAGNYIAIDHGNGMITRYLHLSKISVKVGQKVSVGQLIGEVGNTGGSYGAHLHFDIAINGTRVNPENYYNFEN